MSPDAEWSRRVDSFCSENGLDAVDRGKLETSEAYKLAYVEHVSGADPSTVDGLLRQAAKLDGT